MSKTHQTLTNLLTIIAEAHHQAFITTDGDDPEWPLWYAGRMQKPVSSLFDSQITRSEIVYLLIAAERAQQTADGDTSWPEFYADYFIQNRQSD